MVDANYIVAIDIETSCFIGMIGSKNEEGRISVLAVEREEADGSSIRRGNIYHKESTGRLMKRLIEKLQNRIVDKLPDFRIEKVYVGVGGQSLRSIEHFEMKTLSMGATVSENDLRALDMQCRAYRPDMEDVVAIAPPVYYVDGKQVEQPKGLPAGRIEAHYKLIVGRPSIRNCVMDCVKLTGLQLAGIIVSPLALAEATLGRKEKETGCVLMSFDTGVTSVAVYQHGSLALLSVIPLGVQLITGDLMRTLKLRKEEAEWLKITYGLSLAGQEKNADHPQGKIAIDGQKVDSVRLNAIIEGRIKEIVENVYERIRSMGDMASLSSGIVLTGNASDLKELPELLRQRFNLEVTPAAIRKERMEKNENRVNDPKYMTAISLLIQGTENCLQHISPPKPVEPEPEDVETLRPEGGLTDKKPTGASDKTDRKKRGLSKFIEKIKTKDLFADD
ncbi:MAG: cell division protein FtsA [Tannerella sp.]|jgi:cell division protein FtsA|nr:cell division protein FtsA [Tannerella sp.]